VTTYQLITSSQNLSQFVSLLQTQDEAIRTHERGSAEPAVKPEGLIWQSTDLPLLTAAGFSGVAEGLLRYNAATSSWAAFADTRQIQINAGGTVPFSANQSMGSNKITSLAAGTGIADSVRYDQVILRDGTNAMTADLSLGGMKIINLQDGSQPTDAATKGQLDQAIQGTQIGKFVQENGPFTDGVAFRTGLRNGTWQATVFKSGTGLVGINGLGHNTVKNSTVGDVTFITRVTNGEMAVTSAAAQVNVVNAIHLTDSLA